MPVLIPTEITGAVRYLGHVPDREADLASAALEDVMLTFAGVGTEAHGGETRPSCSRVVSQYPKGTEIRNTRQLSIVSAEDLAAIADAMEIPALDPAWIGASLMIEGIPNFTLIPPSSRLQFASGATVTVDMMNAPCHLPAPVIDRAHPGIGGRFKTAAKHRRGITAWVEREGTVALGDEVRLHIPDQPAYPALNSA